MLHPITVRVCLFLLVFLVQSDQPTNNADALIVPPIPSPKVQHNSQKSSSACYLNFNANQLESLLLGGIFGKEEEQQQEDPVKVLGTWEHLEEADQRQNILTARSSLQNFLQLWVRRLEEDKGLSTPITGTDFREPRSKTRQKEGEEMSPDALVNKRAKAVPTSKDDAKVLLNSIGEISSMKLMFRPPKRYLSYKEQRGLEKGVIPDRKGAKVDAWSPGGVELSITIRQEHPHPHPQDSEYVLALTARRCDIDGDTIIKLSSERAIMRRLEEAIRIWKKVRAMPMPTPTPMK